MGLLFLIFGKTKTRSQDKEVGKEYVVMILGDTLKKILLAGVGTIATTAEKSSEIVEELIKKGEITVEQGKILNKELSQNVKDTLSPSKARAEKKMADFNEMVKGLEADQLASLKAAIADMEAADPIAKAEEASIEAVKAAEEAVNPE